jgi:hypothetical protein
MKAPLLLALALAPGAPALAAEPQHVADAIRGYLNSL